MGARRRCARCSLEKIAPMHEASLPVIDPHTGRSVKVRILDQADEMESVRGFWNAHESHPNNDIDYFFLIARSRKEVVGPLVFALEAEGELHATLAGRIEGTRQKFQFGYMSCGSVRVRKLSFVTSGALGEIAREDARLLIQSVRSSLTERGLDFAVLHNQPVDSWLAREALTGAPALLRDHGGREREHWRMSLPGNFEEFLGRRKKKHRYWLNRLPRVLEKVFPGKVETKVFETAAVVEQFCRDADAVAALTYQRKLGAGFANVGETREYCELLAKRKALKGSILYVDGKPCAYWLASTHRDILFLHATGYDPAFRKYEVGTILFLNLIRDACGTVLKKVDFGLGAADYKERFGDENWLEKDYYVFASSVRCLMLNAAISGGMFAEKFARWVISQARPIGRFKKMWRRLVATAPTVEPENP